MQTIKKLLSLLLCVLLCTAACSALAVDYNANGLFTITYNDDLYLFDNRTYLEENNDHYIWMFMLYQPDVDTVVDVCMEYLEEFDGLTLFSAPAEDRQKYVNATLDAFADNGIQLMDTLTVSDYDIPFYVYSLEDENGEYLIAETLVSGWGIQFSAYHQEDGDSTDNLMAVLEELLNTFQPVIN